MPRLFARSPNAQGVSLELKSGAYRIGRGHANDLQIDHPSVSASHCELTLLSGSLLVRDLGSSNGTFIDRRRINEGTLLFGQVLQVGAIELMLEEPLRLASANLPAYAPAAAFSGYSGALRSCCRHADAEGAVECPRCEKAFCRQCARGLSRMDGTKIRVCPDCGCECEHVVPEYETIEPASEPAPEPEAALRRGLIPHLAAWLKGRLVQGLISQRRQLMQVQEIAGRQAADFERRLADIQVQMQDRIREYEQRITELEAELAAAELEKRQLIRNQIILMKRALAEEREKEQMTTGRARSFSCGSSQAGVFS